MIRVLQYADVLLHNQKAIAENQVQVEQIKKRNPTTARATMKVPALRARIVLRLQAGKSLLLAYLKTSWQLILLLLSRKYKFV